MNQSSQANINHLRTKIDEIDQKIFELIKKREEISSQIGFAKRELDIPDRDFDREKLVFKKAQELAHSLKLPINFATNLQKLIIELALSRQEKDRIKNKISKTALNVSIVGGAGRLGAWLYNFLADSGHRITVVDKAKPSFSCSYLEELPKQLDNLDLIILATPIRVTKEILKKLSTISFSKPVIFDVSSVKAPVKEELLELKNQGKKVSSIHPMFGPSVEILFGKHLIITSLGIKEADDFALNLFKNTSLELVSMSIDDHDQVISYLLSLAHLVNILFVLSLMKGPYKSDYLAKFSSPTFQNLLNNAQKVFSENPHLYYEIQKLNKHNNTIHENISKELEKIVGIIKENNEAQFVDLMKKGHEFLKNDTRLI